MLHLLVYKVHLYTCCDKLKLLFLTRTLLDSQNSQTKLLNIQHGVLFRFGKTKKKETFRRLNFYLFCPAEWTRSVTLPHYKAWYLMHRCHGRQWRTGGTFELTSRWWNAMLSKTTRCLWDTIHERGWMERGWERAVRSAKVTEKGDRKTGRIHRIYIFLSGRLWEKMTA